MTDTRDPRTNPTTELSRRDFVATSIATGVALAPAAVRAALPVTETEVVIKTPDGRCDAAFIHPTSGAHPGVLIWPDAFGLRPAMRAIARRLAAEGYAVLVPNPFYRVAKAPVFENAAAFNFGDPAERAKLPPLMGSVGAAGAAERDAAAYLAFLDAQAPVDKARKIGTQGYCMGGALVLRTAASQPGRIGAGASFHGGGLVTDKPDSPHLLAPKIKAAMHIGVAANDDQRQPDAKDKLKEAFAAAKVRAEVQVYAADHGWCVADMPLDSGKPIYNAPEAERAWGKLLALYKTGPPERVDSRRVALDTVRSYSLGNQPCRAFTARTTALAAPCGCPPGRSACGTGFDGRVKRGARKPNGAARCSARPSLL